MERQKEDSPDYVLQGNSRTKPKAEDYIFQFSQMNECAQHYIYGFICGYNTACGEKKKVFLNSDTGR